MLTVTGLCVDYGSFSVVKDVSFTVSPGQWLMLAGPNGAGKSTVLQAIAQSVSYRGQVLLRGQNLRKMSARERAKQMGLLEQHHIVRFGLTVEEIVGLGRFAYEGGLLGSKDKDAPQAVSAALEMTGLTDLRKKSALTLSGGELQRTFLAQLFAQNPPLLLLDEPVNHLDLQHQQQTFELLERWREQTGGAILSVVHDLSLGRMFGTHALLLHHGVCVAQGSVETVFSDKNLQDVYGVPVAQWMRRLYSQWI